MNWIVDAIWAAFSHWSTWHLVKRISQTKFDLFAIGTRMAITRLISTELSWWSDLDGTVFGAVVLDHTDQDYGWVILVRDAVGRFCCSSLDMSIRSERRATAELRMEMSNMIRDPDFTGVVIQGEEPKKTLNLLEDRGVPDNKLHKNYVILRDQIARLPARKVIEAISPWMVSSDPHLVKEFQENQFDQRLWEIYLWAMFRDQGYDVAHMEAPDLLVSNPWFKFAVEATTVSPSQSGPLTEHPRPETPEEMSEFLHGYMAIKYASPLKSKLDKTDALGRHYWDKPEAEGLPFVLAIADFHHDAEKDRLGPMTYSQGGLYSYMFGQKLSVVEENGTKVGKSVSIEFHEFNGKKIETGFFRLPGAENVSAVIFSNAATLAKFNRLGVLAGFKPDDHTYVRQGFMFNPHPEAFEGIPFSIDITNPRYQETWGDEVQVFHNPNALNPLSWDAFPDAVHFGHEDGEIITRDRPGRVLSSQTIIFGAEK